MTNEEPDSVERFWQLIRVNEDYVRQYANAPCPDASGHWDEQLEKAYERIRPFFRPLAQERFFFAPAGMGGQGGPFVAETAHQALMFMLNPPEALFGCVAVLTSPEYLRIRKEAEQELRQMQDRATADSAEKAGDSPKVDSQNDAPTDAPPSEPDPTEHLAGSGQDASKGQ